jgi:hypothetical protein
MVKCSLAFQCSSFSFFFSTYTLRTPYAKPAAARRLIPPSIGIVGERGFLGLPGGIPLPGWAKASVLQSIILNRNPHDLYLFLTIRVKSSDVIAYDIHKACYCLMIRVRTVVFSCCNSRMYNPLRKLLKSSFCTLAGLKLYFS